MFYDILYECITMKMIHFFDVDKCYDSPKEIRNSKYSIRKLLCSNLSVWFFFVYDKATTVYMTRPRRGSTPV